MASIGQKLRQERERLGIPMSEIARETRISARYLEAIESEDTRTLPQDFFYRSFVRQYAEYLGISADEIATTLRREMPMENPLPLPNPPVRLSILPAKPTSLPLQTAITVQHDMPAVFRTPAIIFEERTSKRWLAVAALLLVGSVSYLVTRRNPADSPTPVAAQVPGNAAVAVSITPANPANSQAANGQSVTGAGPTAVVQATNLGSGRLQIVISAREQTWIKLVADGKNIYMGLIEPGQSQAIQNASNAELLTGNAGGIEVKQNGRSLPGLGSSGEVRTVVFDTENYQVRQPAAKPKVADPAPEPANSVKPAQTTSSTE